MRNLLVLAIVLLLLALDCAAPHDMLKGEASQPIWGIWDNLV